MNKYKFLTIDFESASRWEYSPCAVSIYGARENDIEEIYSTLINPGNISWDNFCIDIHGIKPEDVVNSPTIQEALSKILNILENNIVFAHNAPYDISIINEGCNIFKYNIPNFKYACSMMLAKRTFSGLINYKLDTIAEQLNIDFNHHNASEDALTCAKIVNASMKANNIYDIEELLKTLHYNIGSFENGVWNKAKSKSIYNGKKITDKERLKDVIINEEIETEISGKRILFTGSLNILRSDAMKLCGLNGAIPQSGINKSTNILVVGKDDYHNFKEGNKSTKMIKAEKLIKEGQDLEIITESDFWKLLTITKL